MTSLLHDLLFDTRERCDHLRRELDSLEDRLPAHLLPFRDRWSQLVEGCRGRIESLLADPDLGDPRLASNLYISYKIVTQFLFEVEAGPLVVLARFQEGDLFLTRLLKQICREIGYPGPAPVGSMGSSQYYGALPNVDIVIVPPLEGFQLLGLADLYHELAHFVLRRNADKLVAPFHVRIDRVFNGLIEDARRRNATPGEIDSLETSRAAWKRSWHEEFVADMIATLWVGPAFGWANVRLCTNTSSNLFAGTTSHPADAARHRGVDLMLRRLGFGKDADRIDAWWQGLLDLVDKGIPNDFDLQYPPKLLQTLCDFLYVEVPRLGLVAWSARPTTDDPRIGSLLNQAWRLFRDSPAAFAEHERGLLESLHADLDIQT
ncbi:MAG: hypothetical protein HY718_01785 [Planctomycetes bacterium]|nr:hypothetical protein [Planctomycetota bacterium]